MILHVCAHILNMHPMVLNPFTDCLAANNNDTFLELPLTDTCITMLVNLYSHDMAVAYSGHMY